MMGTPKIGLALGAGGIRGFSHVGVMSVFEENNIPIDLIVGSSVGSLIGSLLADGYDTETIVKLAKGLGRDPWLNLVVPKMGFLSSKKVYEIIKLLTKNKKIEELNMSFAAVATDLYNGEERILTEGSLASAVCASISVPGIFEPYQYGDFLLADGALVNPTPVNIAKDMGADIVIAVDLASFSIVDGIDNIYDVIIRSLDIMEKGLYRYRDGNKACDVLIQPDFSECNLNGFTDFKKLDKLYEIGREAGKKALPEIFASIEKY